MSELAFVLAVHLVQGAAALETPPIVIEMQRRVVIRRTVVTTRTVTRSSSRSTITGFGFGGGGGGSTTSTWSAACQVVIDQYNATANRNNAAYVQRFRQLFGRDPSSGTLNLPQECRQTLDILRWRVRILQASLPLERRMNSVCTNLQSRSGYSAGSLNANSSNASLLAGVSRDLAINTATCQQAGASARTQVASAGRSATANRSGSSLLPGTFDITDTTNVPRNQTRPTTPPLTNIFMGNRPISETGSGGTAGQRSGGGNTQGLDSGTRRRLDALRRDPARLNAYLARLNPTQRARARAYVSDGGTVATTTTTRTTDRRDPAGCAGMRERLRPHAPLPDPEGWIVDQMRRSFCRPDGTRMTLRERTRLGFQDRDRRDELERLNQAGR
jgi:hypothetical protein